MNAEQNQRPHGGGSEPAGGRPGEPFGLNDASGPGASTPPSENEKLLGGLSYASQIIIPVLLPIILLISDETKRSPFLHHHAIQSLGLLIVAILYYMAAAVIYVVSSATAGCLVCVLWVLFLPPIGVLLYYGWLAFRGQYIEIPWLTQFLRDNHWL